MTTTYLGVESFDIANTNTPTVPTGCNAIVAFAGLDMSSNGSTISSLTVTGWTTTILDQIATVGASFERCAAVATMIGGTTGSKTLAITGSSSTTQGPSIHLIYLTVDDTADFVRDFATDNKADAVAATVTIDSASSDMVFMSDFRYSGLPGTPSGYTSLSTVGFNNQHSRVSEADTPGASTTTATTDSSQWSAVAAISIKATAGGGAPVITGPSGKQMTGGFFDLSGGTS